MHFFKSLRVLDDHQANVWVDEAAYWAGRTGNIHHHEQHNPGVIMVRRKFVSDHTGQMSVLCLAEQWS